VIGTTFTILEPSFESTMYHWALALLTNRYEPPTGTVNAVVLTDAPIGHIEFVEKPAVTGTLPRLTMRQLAPSAGVLGALMVCAGVEPLKIVISLTKAVVVADRRTMWLEIVDHHVPGVPAAVQTQIVAVSSTSQSPSRHVPVVGAPLAVPPT
jgi:hypothetical protein